MFLQVQTTPVRKGKLMRKEQAWGKKGFGGQILTKANKIISNNNNIPIPQLI